MKYSLIVDIGNSQIETGLFSDSGLVDKVRFETKCLTKEYDHKYLKAFIDKIGVSEKDIVGGMIFSVVPNVSRLVQIIIKGEIGLEIPLFSPEKVIKELKCNVDNPNEIGQDLIADIVGAIHEYGVPIVVVDLGTVTKNIIIDKDGVFQGVSFFPGVQLNANALTERTAQLPLLEDFEKPELYFGKNTIDAISSGIYYCHVAAIKRFMDKTDEHFGYEFKKVITGGFSNLFKDDFASKKYIVDPNLVLKGMHLIYKSMK